MTVVRPRRATASFSGPPPTRTAARVIGRWVLRAAIALAGSHLAQSVQAADAHRAVEIAADRFLVWHHDRYRVQLVDQKATAAWQKLPRGRLIEELVSLGAGGAAGLISHSVTDAAGTHRDFDLMWFDSHGAATAVVPVPDYVLGVAARGQELLVLTPGRLMRWSSTGSHIEVTATSSRESQIHVDNAGGWVLCRTLDERKNVPDPTDRPAGCRTERGVEFEEGTFASVRPQICGTWLVEPLQKFRVRSAYAVQARSLSSGAVEGVAKPGAAELLCVDGKGVAAPGRKRQHFLPALSDTAPLLCMGRPVQSQSGAACSRRDGRITRTRPNAATPPAGR
jgi:hypothetical protein